MRHPPTGTVTFLFTDIEGSTKLWEQSPVAMQSALARHDQILRECIEAQDGYVFKTMGDAFCAAFATAPEALAGALTAQLALSTEPWQTEIPLRVRMALHTDSTQERDGDYFGPPLNRVARLLATGYGGQTLLSLATQELTRDALPIGASLRDLGSTRLKDLARPEYVFQLLHPALTSDFPPLRSLNNPDLPNNLPQQVTSLIGREKEIDEIKALLDSTRLLTLTGSGGSGKTRLSLQVAADLLDGEGDGVWLVELAALSDPALVPQAVADVLGVREETGKTLDRSLVDALRPKRLLLILDNCEHLVSGCAALAADLLRSCPEVTVLASSREPLNVAGEQTYRVPSLAVPDPKITGTAAALTHYAAVRLFSERAQGVQPMFTVTDANAPAVAQICCHLDGIPLAIELAAARVRSLSAEEINARLDNRFRLLTGGARNTLPRQQTLRALIDWSYDLLTENEKTLLRRLSVFSGGWILPAAEAACLGEDVRGVVIQDWEILDLLTGLVDKSLVVYEEQEAGDGRYRLLETVRQYALERLQESREAAVVSRQAATWFLHLVEEAAAHLAGPDQAAWLRRLETEHDNLRASLAWFLHASSLPDETQAEQGLRLAGALGQFWSVRGHFSEGRQWLTQALQGTAQNAPSQEVVAYRTKALTGAGNLASDQGDYPSARASYEECLVIFRSLGDERGIAASLNNLGLVTYQQGNDAAARALLEESASIRRALGDQQGIAIALNNLGLVAFDQGDYEAARTLYEESMTLHRQSGNQWATAVLLGGLGNVVFAEGDYGAARALYEQSLAQFRDLEEPWGIAESLTSLGRVTFAEGDFAGARDFYEEGLSILHRLGDRKSIAVSLENLAELAQREDELSRASQLMGAACVLRETIGHRQSPRDRKETDTRLSVVRDALGDDPFAVAWETGRGMTLDQTVTYALRQNEMDAIRRPIGIDP